MNQTIYFRKETWEKFKDEPNKSELINNLLEDWYSGKIKNPMPANRKPYVELQPAKYPEPVYSAGLDERGKPLIPMVDSKRLQNGLCKEHGTPLDLRGKCLQRGCKYS